MVQDNFGTNPVNIAINGLGRIGRCVFRAVFENNSNVNIVAVNGPADIEQHVHLLKYDSIHGRFPYDITHDGVNIIVSHSGAIKTIPLIREKSIENINWEKYNADVVMECTGKFTTKEDLLMHIKSGAKKVILSAPSKSDDVKTIVIGVNEQTLLSSDQIISIGSCTTNCLAPIAKVLHENFGIQKGFMTTIHAYTGEQNHVDGSHTDIRRARACGLSMVPTSTGAAKAIGSVLPELRGKLSGSAIRVPTANVSVVDLTFLAQKPVTKDEVNASIEMAAKSTMSGILQYETNPLVSIDFNHSQYSSIFDSLETKVVEDNFIRVLSWYDNEWGFSCRMIDAALLFANL